MTSPESTSPDAADAVALIARIQDAFADLPDPHTASFEELGVRIDLLLDRIRAFPTAPMFAYGSNWRDRMPPRGQPRAFTGKEPSKATGSGRPARTRSRHHYARRDD